MTYEEKLAKVVFKLKEERKITRKGHKTKVIFDDKSFSRVRIGDICKILLKLQDDENVVKILEALQPINTVPDEYIVKPSDDDNYENVVIISVEIDEKFDDWYGNYLLEQKSKPENLEWLNFLKVFDVCSDIDQQLQMTRSTSVSIQSFPYPYLGRFIDLFPFDSIGTRKNYQQFRWEGAKYLQDEGIVTGVKYDHDEILGYGNLLMKVDLTKFDEFFKSVKEEFERRQKTFKNKSEPKTYTEVSKNKEELVWPDDFEWKGKDFIFGKYGRISLVSSDRKHILKVLTDKKGGWASINELKGDKDAGYVRSTIKQIEDRLPQTAKGHISIVSTQDDNGIDKPNTGAYRIKFQP